MREMGNLAGVPIEPSGQTKLLDACVSQAGVIGGGVPGGETTCTTVLRAYSISFSQLVVTTQSGS